MEGSDPAVDAQDAEGGDRFGYGLAAAGALAVVGAPGKEGGRGAAYVFERSRGPWTQAAKLVFAGDRVANDFFGYSAIDLSKALGSAYVFAVGQASGEPCAVDADCAGESRCCEGVCAAFSDCEAMPTTGEISLTDATSAGDSSSSGGGDGSSTGTGGVPEAQLDPLASGCGCGTGGREAPGGWLGLLLVAWRRRR